MKRWRLGGTLLIAAAIRLLPFFQGTAFPDLGGGPDSLYHHRRAHLAAAGADLGHDAWTNYPLGDRIGWPEGYDRALGAALAVGGETAVLFVPPLLGVLATLLLGLWAQRLLDTASAWLAPLVWAVAPIAVFPSAYSNIDHHALEIVLFLVAVGGVARGGAAGVGAALGACAIAFACVPAWPIPVVAAAAAWALGRGTPGFAAAVAAIAAVALPLAGADVVAHPQLRLVYEMHPLHVVLFAGGVSFASALQIGAGILLLPFVARGWAFRRNDSFHAAALGATCVALPLALVSIRFLPYLAVPTALAAGAAWRRLGTPGIPRILRAAAVVSILLVFAGSSVRSVAAPSDPASAAVREALRFLREETPSAGDRMAPTIRPAYGVLSAWDLGFHVVAVAERPAVSAPMWWNGTPRTPAGAVFFSSPDSGTALADALGARFLLLAPTMWKRGSYVAPNWPRGGPPFPEALAVRLYLFGDTGLGWRRVHASRFLHEAPGGSVPSVQVWERDLRRSAETARVPRRTASTAP